jgi:hypothetical protein
VHWNKNNTNLHTHIIFSERQKSQDMGFYDRDIYLTDDGKVARRKADRAKDSDGKEKSPIHKKGDLKGDFTAKDTRYKQKAWVQSMKNAVKQELERFGAVIEPPDPLHEYHEGKGSEAPKIAVKNAVIREMNKQLKPHIELPNFNNIKQKVIADIINKKIDDFAEETAKLPLEERLEAVKINFGQAEIIGIEVPSELMGELTDNSTPPTAPVQSYSIMPLLEAQREFYNKSYALYSPPKTDRPKNDITQMNDSVNRIQQSIKNIDTASTRISDARKELLKYPAWKFWYGKKRVAAKSELSAAVENYASVLSVLEKNGVVMYRNGGEKVTENDLESRQYLKTNANHTINSLQGKIEQEKKYESSATNALKSSRTATQAAQERFINLLREIPVQEQDNAKNALNNAFNTLVKENLGKLAAAKAHTAVYKIITQELPEQKRQKVRSRDLERE